MGHEIIVLLVLLIKNRVLLVLLILELKIIFRTSRKFVNQNTLTHISQDGS